MTGRHAAPPLGSAARDATASPYQGKRRAWDDEAHRPCPHCGGCLTCRTHIPLPDDPPRCLSCGHLEADDCGCMCCTWTCDERPADAD